MIQSVEHKTMANNTNLQNLQQNAFEELISVGLLDINKLNGQGKAPLHIAVKNEKYLLTQALLQSGAEVNAKNGQGQTALAMAIESVLPDMVKVLLDHDAKLDEVSGEEKNALWLAVRTHYFFHTPIEGSWTRIVDLILEHGMKSRDKMQADYYKLCKAIVTNDLRAFTRIINLVEDIDYKHIKTESPLKLAVFFNRLELAEELLKKGANPNHHSEFNRQSILSLGIEFYDRERKSEKKCLKMIKLLLKFGSNVNNSERFYFGAYGKESSERTLFNQALYLRNIELMRLFIHHGTNLSAFEEYEEEKAKALHNVTSLHIAAGLGFSEGVKLLLELGADVHAKNICGITPLLTVCRYDLGYAEDDGIECIKILLNHGAEVTATDNEKLTILHSLATNYHVNLVKYVIGLAFDKEIDINARSSDGSTACHFAECNVLVEFLKNGADLNIQSHDGSFAEYECLCDLSSDVDLEECPAIEYLQRLKHLGYKLKNTDYQFEDVIDLTTAYNQELVRLKNQPIAGSPPINLYDVLFMSRNFMVRYCSNKNLKEILEKCDGDFEPRYPYFGSVLNVMCRRGKNRKASTISAKFNLDKVFGESAPNPCSDMVFKYLTDSKLKTFANEKFGK